MWKYVFRGINVKYNFAQNTFLLPDSGIVLLLFTDVVNDAEDELKTTESKVRSVLEDGAHLAALTSNKI